MADQCVRLHRAWDDEHVGYVEICTYEENLNRTGWLTWPIYDHDRWGHSRVLVSDLPANWPHGHTPNGRGLIHPPGTAVEQLEIPDADLPPLDSTNPY